MERLDIQLDDRGKLRVQTSFEGEESLTVQSDAPLADIDKILKQYAEIGMIDNLDYAEATFQDISEFTDFSDAMRHAKMAEGEFMKLPSKIREIFNHDVAQWLDAAHDPEKRDALVEAGIIERPEGFVTASETAEAERAAAAAAAADSGGGETSGE